MNGSIHLNLFPDIPGDWNNDKLASKWQKIRELRRVVTGALEVERSEKRIGSSLESSPVIYASPDYIDVVSGLDLAEIVITSGASIQNTTVPDIAFKLEDVPGVGVLPEMAKGAKCLRCYKITPEVGNTSDQGGVCIRCADAADFFRNKEL